MNTRAGFLIGGSGAAILGAGASAASAGTGAGTGPYDFAAVAARLERPARHRQVFAVARVADGIAAGYMRHSLDAYERTRGEGAGALHAAAVFYGRGVILGLGDGAWKRFGLVVAGRRRGESIPADAAGNPVSAELGALARRGCTFLVCDNALADWAVFLTSSGSYDGSETELHDALRASLVDGALLVPAGVAALNDAQEARFTYLQASI